MSTTNEPQQQPDPGSRRQRLRQEQEQAAKEKRVRSIISYAVLTIGVFALIGGIVWAVMAAGAASKKPTPSASGAVNTTYTVLVGKPEAPVIVDIYQDFICPFCGALERANSADLTALTASGQAAIRIHPMAFLDSASSGTKYSSRAANDLVTVAKAEPSKVMAFNAILYANQPAENSTGLTDAQIAALAKQAGVSQATIDTFTASVNADFVVASTNEAFADGIDSTPTILINGVAFTGDFRTAGPLKTAIQAAVTTK